MSVSVQMNKGKNQANKWEKITVLYEWGQKVDQWLPGAQGREKAIWGMIEVF